MQAVSSADLCKAFLEHHDCTFLLGAEEDCFGHACIFHPCDVANPAQLHLKQDGLYTGQTGSLEDFFVRHAVLPFDAKDGVQAALMKPFRSPGLLPIENPGLCTVQEVGTTTALYTRIFVERRSEWLCHTLFDSLPKELLTLVKRLSRTLLTVASLEITLPR